MDDKVKWECSLCVDGECEYLGYTEPEVCIAGCSNSGWKKVNTKLKEALEKLANGKSNTAGPASCTYISVQEAKKIITEALTDE